MATKKYVSLEKLTKYDELIKGHIATADAATLQSAKDYADSLATNYDAAGVAATEAGKVQTNLDTEIARAKAEEVRIAGLVSTAQGEVDALETVVAGKAAQSDLDALDAFVGDLPEGATATTIVGYVQEKTAGIATEGAMTELGNRVTTVEGKVATIEGDYLKGSDKTALEGKITEAQNAVQGAVDALSQTHGADKKALEDAIALKADITAMNEVSAVANAAVKQADYDVKVKALEDEDARIVGLVEAEAERAAGVEAGIVERLVEVETFFKTAEGETIDQAMDTLVEIQKYITEDGTAADEMLKDIAANTKAIEDHAKIDHDFATADATLKSELNTEIGKKADKTTVEGIDTRLTTAEGTLATTVSDVSTLKGQMATKAEAQALTDAVATLEDADEAQVERIAALEGKFGEGEGTVGDMISDAVGAEATRVDGLLANKVDKVTGKGLSTNDLTNELKGQYDAAYAHSQAAHAPVDAQKNIIEVVKVNGTALTITDKAVDVSVPTDNAQLTNGAGYLVASDIANKADKATTLAGYGISDAYTTAQTDTAIANAVAQFVECSEQEIMDLFKA